MESAERIADCGPREGEAPAEPERRFKLLWPDADQSDTSDRSDQSDTSDRSDTSAPAPINWSAIAAAEQIRVEIPEDQRQAFSEAHTLRQFYSHATYGLESLRRARVADGTLAANTLAKDASALNRWERYSPRPRDWPAGQAWEGRPIAWITDQHVTDTVTAMRRELSGTTCRSTWGHLRTILHRAVEVKALERVPAPTWPKSDGRERRTKEMYEDGQLAEIYTALAGHVDLQVAFVTAVNVGPRAVDLFTLRWEDFSFFAERPVVEFTARKTGKRQVVPLAEVTLRQLDRWKRASGVLLPVGLVWPELTDAAARDPERSRAARDRNARFKRILATLGIAHERPWQVCRLTCNERLERHRPGAGQFVLGHASTLNSVSYRDPSGLIYEAVSTLPQPECFRV